MISAGYIADYGFDMIDSFDTDNILFSVLNSNVELKTLLTGGIYPQGERPLNSNREDICVNTINLTQEYIPQSGTSNVNIYVADKKLKIEGQEQYIPNRKRLKLLAKATMQALSSGTEQGLQFWISNQNVIREQSINQHYINLRIEWQNFKK
ncbi:MAG: hypothetical protein LBS01_02340 [Prevotellaceae bacterium]|jgi:hypothetical protein|nr:hypothetical protein [Prevotellaceae bacterium]